MAARQRQYLRARMLAWAAVMTALLSSTALSTEGQVISSKGAEVSETGLGNLIADAIRRTAGADVGFIPASVLRPVQVTVDQLSAAALAGAVVDPDEPVALMALSGAQILEALERSLSLSPKPNKGFLQVSGLMLKYDASQPPGKRLHDVKTGRTPLDPQASYTVAMPRSLAAGGLGYFRVWGSSKPLDGPATSIGKALADFLGSKVDYSAYVTDGRIRRTE